MRVDFMVPSLFCKTENGDLERILRKQGNNSLHFG